MLSQLSRATRARSAVAAVSRVARPNAVQVRGFIAPTVSRKGKILLVFALVYAFENLFRRRDSTTSIVRFSWSDLSFCSRICTPPELRSDFVQELYLKELKAYKIPVVKESDSEGNVQTFNIPKTPTSPEETDLAGNLKEYESMAVEIEGQDTAAQGAGTPEVADWLEAEEDEEPHH
ncbi:hypothetical protein FGRMN_7864 [Fusarium graminum]|nr:hypothetical protein FGRMN_7864 [Fusarium graminum]